MTDWQARVAAKLQKNREAAAGEQPRCIGCDREFRRTEPTCWTERRGPGREGPYCYDCWSES